MSARTASSSAARLGKFRYEGGDADPGLAGDLLQGGFQAVVAEHLPGGFDDGVAVALGVAPQWPWRWAVGGRHGRSVPGNTEAYLRIVLDERSTGGPPPFMEGVVAMTTNVETTGREAVLVQDAARIQMMGLPVLEALPARGVPYQRVDPFLLVHESRFRLSELSGIDTKHPHRGFDNLWYILEGSASTGHSTGPDGAIERARLPKGALLALRTGRGAWHAEGIGAEEREEGLGDTEWRSVLFWVNLARKDKQAAPSALVLQPDQIPVRREGEAMVRVLVGEGSPVRLGTPALILDVELPDRRTGDHPGAGRSSRASPTSWTARPPSGPTAAGPGRPSWSCWVPGRVRGHRRRPRHPVPAHGRPALRGDSRCSTGRSWTSPPGRRLQRVPPPGVCPTILRRLRGRRRTRVLSWRRVVAGGDRSGPA